MERAAAKLQKLIPDEQKPVKKVWIKPKPKPKPNRVDKQTITDDPCLTSGQNPRPFVFPYDTKYLLPVLPLPSERMP
jgi:hypothetical protein